MRRRLLASVTRFCQGCGGVPESLRLLANALQDVVDIDVLDLDGVVRDIGALEALPQTRAPDSSGFDLGATYDAFMIFGPWQRQLFSAPAAEILAAQKSVYYLPRGGLCHIEFNSLQKKLKKYAYYAGFERRLVARARTLVLSSDQERDQAHLPRDTARRARIIPDFVAESRPSGLATPHAAPERPVTFGAMAELHPRKGIVPAIHAFAAFKARSAEPCQFLIGGAAHPSTPGYLDEIRATIATHGLGEAVTLLGPIAAGDRESFYRSLDVFVSPSEFESYGLTVLEALNRDVAVVTTAHVGILQWLPELRDQGLFAAAETEPALLAAAMEAALAFRRTRSEPGAIAARAYAGAQAINAQARTAWMALIEAT